MYVHEIMNRPNIMNEIDLKKKFQELLRIADWLEISEIIDEPKVSDRLFDFMARISVENKKVELWVECKAEIRPSQVPMLDGMKKALEQQQGNCVQVPVLAARHVSPRLAEICAERGWSWFDLAGNCKINVPGHLYLERSGNKSVAPKKISGANLGSNSAASVLRALMITSHDGFWSQRELQSACKPSVSLGLVNKVVRHLRDEGYLTEDEKGGYALRDAVQLLQAWRNAYRFDRVKQVRCFTLLRAEEIEKRLVALNESGEKRVVYASFSAAEIQAPAVRQSKKWFAVLESNVEDVMDALESRIVDSGDNVVLLAPPDEGMLVEAEERGKKLACTHPIQTWLDVSHSPGRGKEAAEAILEQCLKPEWRDKGWIV